MAKKGPVGKAEIFYIDQHREKITVDELCKDLDRTKAAINKYLKDNPAKLQTMVDKNITRHKGGAVMTENASSLADNIPKSSKLHSRYDSCVTTIKKWITYLKKRVGEISIEKTQIAAKTLGSI